MRQSFHTAIHRTTHFATDLNNSPFWERKCDSLLIVSYFIHLLHIVDPTHHLNASSRFSALLPEVCFFPGRPFLSNPPPQISLQLRKRLPCYEQTHQTHHTRLCSKDYCPTHRATATFSLLSDPCFLQENKSPSGV